MSLRGGSAAETFGTEACCSQEAAALVICTVWAGSEISGRQRVSSADNINSQQGSAYPRMLRGCGEVKVIKGHLPDPSLMVIGSHFALSTGEHLAISFWHYQKGSQLLPMDDHGTIGDLINSRRGPGNLTAAPACMSGSANVRNTLGVSLLDGGRRRGETLRSTTTPDMRFAHRIAEGWSTTNIRFLPRASIPAT